MRRALLAMLVSGLMIAGSGCSALNCNKCQSCNSNNCSSCDTCGSSQGCNQCGHYGGLLGNLFAGKCGHQGGHGHHGVLGHHGGQGGHFAGAPVDGYRMGFHPAARYAGPPTGTVTYPYYTNRGPRDFLASNPRDIGP